MKGKKILYVRNGPYVVNPSMYNLQEIGFCRALCDRGYDCDIVYYSKINKDEVIYLNKGRKVKILWRKGLKVLRTGIYPSLLSKKFGNNYDLIITTEYSQIMTLLWSIFNPKVVLYNGPYYNLFKLPFLEKVYDILFVPMINKKMYKIFTKSELSTTYLSNKGFTNIKTLGVGLNTNVFNEVVDVPNEVEDIKKFVKDKKVLLYIGTLDDRKNFPFLLELFEEISNCRDNIKLVIIGNGNKDYISKQFKNLNKKAFNRILHIPKLENKYLNNVYSIANIFLLPSKKEIFGMVLLEAMQFGCVPVSSLNGGSSTLIKNNFNGIVLNNFDVNDWKSSVLSLLDNQDVLKQYSLNSIETIKRGFVWESIADVFLEELENEALKHKKIKEKL